MKYIIKYVILITSKGDYSMLKIDKNCWIVYNKDGTLVTIDAHNRDNDRNVNKLKGYERTSILDDEYDNSEYSLHWNIWNNKTNMTNEQIRKNIDKKLSLLDYATLKYKTSILNRTLTRFLVVGGELLEPSNNEQVIDLIYDTICSHFDKDAICWQYRYQSSGYTHCTREQAKAVLKTFEQMEKSQNIEEENILGK